MPQDRKSREYHAENYAKYGKAWYENNKDRQRETQRRYRERFPERGLWRNARLRARKDGLDFNISVEDISIPEKCPVFGVPFEVGNMNAASLDRIDNSKGYVKGNIQVMSRRANTMKGNSTIEELRLFAAWVSSLV